LSVLIDAIAYEAKEPFKECVSIIAEEMTNPPSPSQPLVDASEARIFLTTITPGKARSLAGRLVEEGLAACVNLGPGLRSIYRWKADILDEPETLLIIKTTAQQEGALARRLCELHPYEVPELLGIPPSASLPAYLAWLAASTAPQDDPKP
jgi:periplasmic divalent cation tolerance protein